MLGTPDYANWQWVWMEKAYGLAAPGGYADEHIAHYTQDELCEIFAKRDSWSRRRATSFGRADYGVPQEGAATA